MVLSATDRSALCRATHPDPFAALGWHAVGSAARVAVLLPGASAVRVIARQDQTLWATLHPTEPGLIFEGAVAAACQRDNYRLQVQWGEHLVLIEDPYSLPPILGDVDLWLLAEGRHLRPHQALGARPMVHAGLQGVAFTVWAPNARRVSVVGDFNYWDGRRHPMRLRRECGVWELFLPEIAPGSLYKFELLDAQGHVVLKSDPYGHAAQLRPQTASVVTQPLAAKASRAAPSQATQLDQPISIYEVHLGSWRRHPDGRWLTYLELAQTLIPYARDLGFTHLELLPITEHPFDGSWGYQPLGMFAPTARFGTPEQFNAFIAAAHDAGLGVVLDWVPAHFPSDAHGLAQFDGTHLYEHADPREGFHPDWNTLIYNFGRREVVNFLVGNALYWLESFGLDGLRVDAVASMLYRDYSRQAEQWIPNQHGGRENLEAIAFLQRMNHVVGTEQPGKLTFAEESTAFAGVTRPPEMGGLGFHFKWNMGWMHDTLNYFKLDPIYRKHHHNLLTFGQLYAYSENFVLPLSHDEVVHGKGSLLARMPGDHWQRFANLRALFALQWASPGKKLIFMGCEWGQTQEWSEQGQLQWDLLAAPQHSGVQRLVRDLNAVYRHHPALHRQDRAAQGFAWLSADDAEQSVMAFERHSGSGETVVVIGNFTPVVRHEFRIGMPQVGRWKELINSDNDVYGGSGVGNPVLTTEPIAAHGRDCSVRMTLPPLAVLIWTRDADPS